MGDRPLRLRILALRASSRLVTDFVLPILVRMELLRSRGKEDINDAVLDGVNDDDCVEIFDINCVSDHDHIINHTRRNTTEGFKNYQALRGERRRTIDDNEAQKILDQFQEERQISGVVIQPVLWKRYKQKHGKLYFLKKATVKDIQQSVSAKRQSSSKPRPKGNAKKQRKTAVVKYGEHLSKTVATLQPSSFLGRNQDVNSNKNAAKSNSGIIDTVCDMMDSAQILSIRSHHRKPVQLTIATESFMHISTTR